MKSISIKDLTPAQVRQIAEAMPNTTVNSLRHVVTGVRGVSSARAIAIEKAAATIGLSITRESLNPGCAKCEFARACRRTMKDCK